MSTFLRNRSSYFVGAVVAMAMLVVSPGMAHGQAGAIGARGGQTVPTVSPTPTLPSTPVLPSSLNLPAEATSSLLKGLDASGTALRPGMGWLVSDLTHQGITGRQLADIIHQLKPYKQHGVLTFPQEAAPTASQPQQPTGESPRFDANDHGREQGHGHRLPGFGKGRGGRR